MYVACTRARQELHLYAPQNIYNRAARCNLSAEPSPFVCEIEDDASENVCLCGNHVSNDTDEITAHADQKKEVSQIQEQKSILEPGLHCHHPIFGEGKVLCKMDTTSVKVQFIHYGEKIIRIEYLNFGN